MKTTSRNVFSALVIIPIFFIPGLLRCQDKALELSTRKAGPVEIGMTIDELYRKVGRERTKLVDTQAEGFFSPVVEIYLKREPKDAKPALVAEVVTKPPAENAQPLFVSTFVVGRITVNDPQFKTNVGIGVGSTLGDIRRWYKVDWITFGEGPLFARVEQIGMSFALDYGPSQEWYATQNQALIPDSAKVVSILLTQPQDVRKHSK